MRFLVPLTGLILGALQLTFAQGRTFTGPELKGIQKAVLETLPNGTERVIGFWKYQFTPVHTGGVIVLDIVSGQLKKVWEDNKTFSYTNSYDANDLNGDGQLDFVVAGIGLAELGNTLSRYFAIYLSDGANQYQRHIVPRKTLTHHIAIGDIDGDRQNEVVFTEQYDSYSDSEEMGWLELEVKIGRWQNSIFRVQGTGVTLDSGDHWYQLILGDIDNDGRDEAVIHQDDSDNELGRSVLVYDLDGRVALAHTLGNLDSSLTPIPKLSVSKGQLLQFESGSINPTVLPLGRGFSKIAPIELPETDLANWETVQVSTNLILSQPRDSKSNERQLILY